MAVYNAVVIPTLLYASETWTTYRRHLDTLEKFHQRCLRSILNISWEDRRTNVSVLKAAKATSIEAHIIKSQLRWTSADTFHSVERRADSDRTGVLGRQPSSDPSPRILIDQDLIFPLTKSAYCETNKEFVKWYSVLG
ncbi:uncharacterized protein LOC143032667 [Oratosquilla oratoria]|uniref:uncharacterized protein LOC143032667 n=1 Tax=Oratosquilla oratoria TaxID=337810 RepID=UPI003F75F978